MMRVGLTGNIGSGKTTVCRLFEMLGVPVYYADERGKHFLASADVARQVKDQFGEEYLLKDGSPDRKKLAHLVFNDQDMLNQLNAIIHPKVQMDFEKWVALHHESAYVIMEAAILFESGRNRDFDTVILVTAPEDLRIERVCRRDKVTVKEVVSRMENQWDEARKIPLADFVIRNDEKELLMPQAEKVHHQLVNASRNGKQPDTAK